MGKIKEAVHDPVSYVADHNGLRTEAKIVLLDTYLHSLVAQLVKAENVSQKVLVKQIAISCHHLMHLFERYHLPLPAISLMWDDKSE